MSDPFPAARIRRDPPERSGPLRHATAMWRPDEPSPGPGAAPSGPVESAVSTAYQGLEQALRRGRDAAFRYTSSATGDPAMGSERNGHAPQDPYSQAFRTWTNLLTTWADLMGPLFARGMPNPWGPAAAPSETPAQALRLVLDVASSRPLEVELDLQPSGPGTELAVQDLRAFEDGKPPIAGARLERLEGDRLRIHLRVPQEQPGGVYAGVVYDPRRRERLGSLTVRVPA
jgi:hypothetical protein